MVWIQALAYSGQKDVAQQKLDQMIELWNGLPKTIKVSNRRMLSQFQSMAAFHKLNLGQL